MTAKQNQKEEKLTDKIKEMLRDRRKLLERGEWRTVEFVELNKLIRRLIKENIRNKHDKMIDQVIERNQSMKVLRPSLGKNIIIALKDRNGKEMRDKSKIEERVQEFYSELYQIRQHPLHETEAKLKRRVLNVNSEDIPEITTEEINSALHEMKNNKAPGMDYITKDLLQNGGEEILQTLKILFNRCLDAGKVASDWKKAITVLL